MHMKIAVGLLAFTLFALSTAQEARESLYSTVRPDIAVLVKEHPTGAEDVEVTALAKDYPAELMRKQCAQIGEYLGIPSRGIAVSEHQIEGNNPDFRFLTATFATTGLIDRENGIVLVEPIVKSFAGAPEPFTVKGMSIMFDEEEPNDRTIREYKLPSVVEVEGRYSQIPKGIDYRVRLISQDPDELRIPLEQPKEDPRVLIKQAPSGLGKTFWLVFTAAGVAVVALVYFLLLRIGRGPQTPAG